MSSVSPAETVPAGLNGLTDAEVQERIGRGAVNRSALPVSRTVLQIVRANVLTRFNALLGTLCIMILATGPWQDALFGGVLVVNALIGMIQELRAKRALDRLALVNQPVVRVLRVGKRVELGAADIVNDDLFELASGDQAVVDGVVVVATGLEIDESLLTGESEPVGKDGGQEVLSGSFVIAGSGWCRATRVGAAAYGQHLASEARRFSLAQSELRTGIDRILRYITWAIAPTLVLLFSSQFVIDRTFSGALLYSAGGVVAMVPEGLVLLTSLALAVAAVRLARHRALVQDLPATETLARVDVVCLDKTGTLTEREPRLERIEPLQPGHSDAVRALTAIAGADPGPNATLRAIRRAYSEEEPLALNAYVPFSPVRKWSGADLGAHGNWVLGAPEALFGAIADSASARRRAEAHARDGWRVLLLARTGRPFDSGQLPADLTAVALLLFAEEIRADAAETLRYLGAQGVAIKVFSGDHPATVGRIASELGIAHDDRPVDARELPEDAAQFRALVEARSVFGRLSPRQKQSLVAALQDNGHRVAMVGDGVNDVLALKRADIGIAMAAGAGVARAVSQLVLLDNRFSCLPAVIGEGRRVIGNVERLAALFLTKTVYAMILALVVGIAGVTFPFLPRHLTLVGTLTIGVPAFFLSLEQNTQRAKSGFVERVMRFAVLSGLFVAGATFAVYALTRSEPAVSLAQARTAATVTLFAVATWVVVMVARPLRLGRSAVLAGTVAAFVLVLCVAWLRAFFALEPLPPVAWLYVAAVAAATAVALRWGAAVAERPRAGSARVRPLQLRQLIQWALGENSPKWMLTLAAFLVVGGAWLFFGVLEDIVTHDRLVDLDVFVYHLMQSIRTPGIDRMMIAITELADAQVLLPVILVTLAWLLVRRLWLTAGYWLTAIGIAEALANVLKLTLHRVRPGPLYSGAEQFSFPSGHAMMSAVVYGFLAFLLSRQARPGLRRTVLVFGVALVSLIAFSRIYLGAHWLSDVLGGLSFGVAWVAAFAVAYEYQSHDRIRPQRLAAIVLATVLIAGGVHIATSGDADRQRYAPPPLPASQRQGGDRARMPGL
ncbi:MAG: HAD-IC family P-type ATPase [Gammaproteobacteria bacterium]|nr:HAD-IC family P-type ATPase [Gammaproteobacteria bacterium]